MNHAIELANCPIGVCDHGEVNLIALSLFDVFLPPLMGFYGVHGQPDDFHASFVKLWFYFSNISELGCADWSKIFGMREKDSPTASQPVMKVDLTHGSVCFEVGGNVTKSDVANGCFLLFDSTKSSSRTFFFHLSYNYY